MMRRRKTQVVEPPPPTLEERRRAACREIEDMDAAIADCDKRIVDFRTAHFAMLNGTLHWKVTEFEQRPALEQRWTALCRERCALAERHSSLLGTLAALQRPV